MTGKKRILDIALALGLLPLALPVLLLLLLVMAATGERPFFYVSKRMKTPTQGFLLLKLRSMAGAAPGRNSGVSGGDKQGRISRFGAFLRHSRLDELPQLWNILRGDMSFVGPRPPLPRYVRLFPDLYARVLETRPGITGLATLTFHAHEERLLQSCRTAAETEAVYITRCIPRKARLDLIYRNHRSVCLDLWLLLKTAARLGHGLSRNRPRSLRDERKYKDD